MSRAHFNPDFCEGFGGFWGAHPDWPVQNWRSEVADDNTRLGYWEWVQNQIENAALDEA